VSWSLDEGRMLRCVRRAAAPSSAILALMVGEMRGFVLACHSGDGLAESGRGDFRRMSTRRYLWIVPGSQRTR
jgi:hypothetical protein